MIENTFPESVQQALDSGEPDLVLSATSIIKDGSIGKSLLPQIAFRKKLWHCSTTSHRRICKI